MLLYDSDCLFREPPTRKEQCQQQILTAKADFLLAEVYRAVFKS